MLTPEERDWVITVLHACPIRDYFAYQDNIEELQKILLLYIQYLANKNQNPHLTDPLPNNLYGNWVRNIVDTCPRWIISGSIDKELLNYAIEIAQSKIYSIIRQPELLNKILSYLNTKQIVNLASTSSILHREIGYDPFGGSQPHLMLGYTSRTNLNPHDHYQALAKLAFNTIYDKVSPYVADHPRPTDKKLTEQSSNSYYGSSGNSFIATNCVSTAYIPKLKTGGHYNAVNFISYSSTEQNRLTNDLKLNPNDYRSASHKHAEIRIIEKQDDAEQRYDIYIDKPCCPFCAVQIIVLGSLDKTRGAKFTKLAWYTFSPYILSLIHI